MYVDKYNEQDSCNIRGDREGTWKDLDILTEMMR